jgi:hypothetical protein
VNTEVPAALSLRELIEVGSKMAIGATAACFAVGLLVVNIRLSGYGVYSNEFVRTEYVIVGAAFVVLVTIAGVAAKYGIATVEKSIELLKNGSWKRGGFQILLAVMGILTIPIYTMMMLSGGRLGYENWKSWAALVIFAVVYIHLSDLRKHLSQLWKSAAGPAQSRDSKNLLEHGHALVWPLINVLAMVGAYATIVYPDLSPVYGGGHRDALVLMPTTRGSEVGASVGLPILPDKAIGPVQLLTESDKELIVARTGGTLLSPPHAVRISRDLIEAIAVFEPNKAPNNATSDMGVPRAATPVGTAQPPAAAQPASGGVTP